MTDSKQREIKFRLIKDGKIIGYEVAFIVAQTNAEPRGYLSWIYLYDESGKNFSALPIPHDSKDQFTGARDCKKCEIYEHDIMQMGRSIIVVIRYDSGICPGFSGVSIIPDDNTLYAIGFSSHGVHAEVIGNKWENPELLEVSND